MPVHPFGAEPPGLLWAAAPLLFLLGLAIQRGATCLVRAVGGLVLARDPAQALAIAMAALWVSAIFGVALLAGGDVPLAARHAAGWQAAGGGILLGLGAWWSRACVMGAVARVGQGEWAYLLTPAGLLAGMAAARHLGGAGPGPELPSGSPPLLLAPWLPVGMLVLALLAAALRARRLRFGLAVAWSPPVATAVIGITFALLALMAAPWSHTEVLASIAETGTTAAPAIHLALFLALFAGSVAGGHLRGRVHAAPETGASAVRVLSGSVVMGAGSVLVPGSNDTLVLMGVPALAPQALLGLVAMAAAIAAAMLLSRRRAAATA